MPPGDLATLLARAMAARRRGDAPRARGLLVELLEAAREADSAPEMLLAQAHLAALDDDRERAEQTLARVAELLPTDERAAALGMVIAERWPADPRDSATHLVATSRMFRRLCRSLPQPDEVALELGAAHGRATRVLARRCAFVYAVEKSPSMAERAREATQDLANVRVIVADAEELGLARAHAPQADVICLDLGGSSSVGKIWDVARWYRDLYQPRVLLVRSVYLNNFVAGLASFEPT